MTNYLLDTSVIIDCLRGRKKRGELLRKLVSEGSILGCCLVNIIEVYAGMKEKEREITQKLLDSFEYYEATKEVAKLSGDYKREYKKRGVTLSLSDVTIAALSIFYNLILLTDNPKHYPMSEIKFYTPK